MKTEVLVPNCEIRNEHKYGSTSPHPLRTRPFTRDEKRFFDTYSTDPETTAELGRTLAFRLTGSFEPALILCALDSLVKHHRALRTTYSVEDDVAHELSRPSCVHEVANATDWTDAHFEDQLKQTRQCHFDLASGSLFKAFVYKRTPREYVVVLCAHQIVADLISFQILLDDFCRLMSEFATGQPTISHSMSWMCSSTAAENEDYPLAESSPLGRISQARNTTKHSETSHLILPFDRSSGLLPDPTLISSMTFSIPPETAASVASFAGRHGADASSVYLAVYCLFLSRYANDAEIELTLPSPISRQRTLDTAVLGRFSPPTLLGVHCSRDGTFRELLAKTIAQLAVCESNAPFASSAVLSPASFTWEQIKTPEMNSGFELQGPDFLETSLAVYAPFDLSLRVQSLGDSLKPALFFRRDRFAETTVRCLADQFVHLLTECLSLPEERISSLNILSKGERSRILAASTGEKTRFPDLCLHQLFSAQVARRENAEAVVFHDRRLSYRELELESNRLARLLRARGIRHEDRVGIFMERSAEMVISILAILKAGGVYVPLDPDYPEERINFLVADIALTCILTHGAVTFPTTSSVPLLAVDEAKAEIQTHSGEPLGNHSTPESTAIIIYTSGSTGLPKGACIPHRAAVRTVCNTNYVQALDSDRVAQAGSPSFDAAITEIWLPLTNGATLVGVPRHVLLDMRALKELITRERISIMVLNTSYVHQIGRDAPEVLKDVRKVLFGGEAAEPGPLKLLLKHVKPGALVNGYGPAEGCVITTYHDICSISEDATVPIGKPVANARVYLLDEKLRIVPIGTPGEIYIGGDGVAKGYWNRPELTAERFVPDSFSEQPGALLYRTGDLARLRSNGEFEFLGRVDELVKIRGHRIELAEVRHVVASHSSVKQVFLMVREDQPGDRRLVAYVTLNQPVESPADTLRVFCRRKLPAHMVPAAFVVMNSIPLNVNGKVDRKALPSPNLRPGSKQAYEAGRSDTERRLQQIWNELLRIEAIGIHDNFFDLGGHSLLAARLIARIEKELGQNIPVAALFEAPTISQLAQKLKEDNYHHAWSPLVGLHVTEDRGSAQKPFFCVHSLGANLTSLHRLASLMDDHRPVYGLQPHGLDETEEPLETVEAMAAAYIQEIRKKQPVGPYLVGGICLGGVVAYEMAQQLVAAGQEVALVAMIDSFMPGNLVYLHSRPGLTEYLDWHIGEMLRVRGIARLQYLFRWLSNGGVRFKRLIGLRDRSSLARATRKVAVAHLRAISTYQPKPYAGKVVQLMCSDASHRCYEDRRLAWSTIIAEGFEIQVVPGNHLNMVEEPHARTLARELQLRLDRASNLDRAKHDRENVVTQLNKLASAEPQAGKKQQKQFSTVTPVSA